MKEDNLYMTNKLYDIAKYIVQIVLPALITLVSSIAVLYNYDVTIIVDIISAVTVFLGSLLGLSTISYNHKQNTTLTGLEDNPSINELNQQKQGE